MSDGITDGLKDTLKQASEELTIYYSKCPECKTLHAQKDLLLKNTVTETILVCPDCAGVINPEESLTINFTIIEVQRLNKIKKLKSDLVKEEKKLSEKMKKFLLNNEIDKFTLSGVKMKIGEQDKSTINDEKLVEIIKQKIKDVEEEIANLPYMEDGNIRDEYLQPCLDKIIAYECALIQITITNPNIVKDLIIKGLITDEDIISCRVDNIIKTFKVGDE